ncbi:S1C family serine protease [Oceanobacillus sp. Castelsardo]|uniref:S1C family serine protease n=1 Tax=Oceanobacillus sp. Castelsardo TaxID=1851204 RepID=UPI000839415A|nr:trypsin-like peptidase domain-containing protein [Oceanobacillus sp. Castelsardo]
MNDNDHRYSQGPDFNHQENKDSSVDMPENKDVVEEHNYVSPPSQSSYDESNIVNERRYHTVGNKVPPYPQNTKKQGKPWLTAIFGGIVGGILSAVLVTILFTNGVIETENISNSEKAEAVQVDGTPMIEKLAAEDANVSTNIQEVSEAVVGVVNLQQQSIWTGSEEAGTGSGIIYKKEDGKAYVVTNQHVVDGAEQVEVVLNEEERVQAKVLGEDALTDLAVLEIEGQNINTIADITSSEDLIVGETVLAIGNPLGLEFANSVTKGIVSGLNRSVTVDTNSDGQPDWVTEVIQTDAAINPGNSGGALVNADGQVIGINSMKIAQSSVEGIGFAIPASTALPIMEQLEKEGEITRPQIGISTVSLLQVPPQYRYEINLPDEIEGGMVIANIQPNSPADRAGLKQFDVITKIDGNEVTSVLELRKYLYSKTTVGDNIELEYVRNGEFLKTNLKLEEMVK